MPDVTIAVKTVDQGSQGIRQMGTGLDSMVGKALKVGAALGGVGLALGAMGRVAEGVWSTLGDGAALELASSRFENLAKSIDTTADSLLGKMREATSGMISDAQLMASGTDIMSLGLAKTEDQTVRLASVIGQLGWDMQQVVLTMANNSKMRLDALGLSVEDIDNRVAKLRETGMSLDEAFDLAVIEAGEAKLELLGSAADTSAGKIKILQAAAENAGNAFEEAFAVEVADDLAAVAGGAEELGDNLEYAAEGAAKLAAFFVGGAFKSAAALGQTAELGEMARTIEALGGDLDEIRQKFPAAFSAGHQNMAAVSGAIAAMESELIKLESAAQAANPELNDVESSMATGVGATRRNATALSEWTDEAKEAAIKAGELAGELAGLDIASVAGATQEGIWRVAGNHIQSILDEAAEAAEAEHREAAEAIAEAYEEAARRMSSAFSAALQGGGGFDFGDTEAMSDAAWEMAQAFGLTVPLVGQLGIDMGKITPEMAEAATKAVLFQEAFGVLLGQLQAGNLDTSGFITAYETLISDLQSKSLVEIQLELKLKENPARDPWAWLPQEERVKEVEVPVKFTPEESALNTVLGMIDGIPDNDEKIITFTAAADEVIGEGGAVSEIQTAITAIDATVVFEPDSQVVDDKIELLDESRLTVYVDFVTGNPPAVPGNAVGGAVTRGKPTIVGEAGPELFVPWTHGTIVPNHELGRGGEMQLVVYNYFYGPTDANAVSAATQTAGERLLERVRQAVLAV